MFGKAMLFSCALVVLAANISAAQRPVTNSGSSRTLSLGIMALGDYEGDGGAIAMEWTVARLSSRFSVGIGGMAGVQHNSEPYGSVRNTTYTVPLLGVSNIQYQSQPNSRLALYGGVTAGITHVAMPGYKGVGLDERGNKSSVGVQVGARFRLASRMGLMAQLGVGDQPAIFSGLTWRW